MNNFNNSNDNKVLGHISPMDVVTFEFPLLKNHFPM